MAVYKEDSEKLVVEFGGKSYILSIMSWDSDMDLEDLSRIDYSNILGEIITFPVVMNRMGLIKAEVDTELDRVKLDFEIGKAKLVQHHREALSKKGLSATAAENMLKTEIALDPSYEVLSLTVIQAQSMANKINAVYWAFKDKSDKLNRLSEKLRPEDFEKEILTDSVNNVAIKYREKLIK